MDKKTVPEVYINNQTKEERVLCEDGRLHSGVSTPVIFDEKNWTKLKLVLNVK